MIKEIFLLILAVSGNFVKETLSCKTQKLLNENMLAKHLIVFLIIYFSLGFTSEKPSHPVELATNSLIIWVLFLLITKMSLEFTILVFVLLSVRYILTDYIEYYKSENEEKNKDLIENVNLLGEYISSLIIGLVILGFTLYLRRQYKDHYGSWSTFKFIFGVSKCKSPI